MAYVEGLDDSNTGDDGRLHVRFHLHPVQNGTRSAEEGRPVFDDVEYVEITVPGDKNNQVDRPAREEDKRRFARQYDAFKRGDGEAHTGTPLKEWPQVTRSQVEELAYFKIKTVEQLAAMSDGNLRSGFLSLREKAKDFLEKAKGNAVESKLRAELQDRDAKMAAMQAQIDALVESKKPPPKGAKP